MKKSIVAFHGVGVAAAAFLGFVNLRCGAPIDGVGDGSETFEGEEPAPIGTARQDLYSAPTSRPWPNRDIPVCWEATTWDRADYATHRQNVRTWIEDSFGRVTDLKFGPWNRCPANANGMIVLKMDDQGGAQASRAGYDPNVPTQVYASPSYWAGLQVGMMHEFAHGLGFDHEIDRPDMDNCFVHTVRVAGTNHTPYDRYSVTNATYCHTNTTLSPWDVVGLQRVYGRKPSGAIVGWKNKCLDIDNPAVPTPPSAATRVQVWPCRNNLNQYWVWEADRIHEPNYFWGTLDIQNANTANGTPAWNWQMNDNAAQKWYFSDAQLVGMGDLCLDVTGGVAAAGSTARLSTCNRNIATQKWNMVPTMFFGQTVRFKVTGTNLCLTITGRQSQGTLQTCADGDPNQSFGLSAGGRVFGPNWCLDVQWGNPVDGAVVWGWECQNPSAQVAEAQRWYIRGPLHGIGGKCLDVDVNSGVVQGSKVQLWSCNQQPQQTWEYHF
jgi:hypothetical protein